MAVSNGVISAPVTITDIKDTLGESTDNLSELCKSDRINMWAKWKPIACNSIVTPSDDVKKSLNYGLSNFAWGGASVLADLAAQENGGIVYTKPNELYPYCRMGDFNRYNHNADAPILNNNISISTSSVSNAIGNTVGVSFFLSLPTDREDTITLHDIPEIQDAYPAVVFYYTTRITGPTGVTYRYTLGAFWTSDKTVSEYTDTAISLVVPVGNVAARSYNLCVCFSKYQFNWSDNWTEAGSYPSLNLAPLPMLQLDPPSLRPLKNSLTVTQHSTGGTDPDEGAFSWGISADLEKVSYDSSIYHLNWRVYIYNWGTHDISLSDNTIYIVHTNW